MTAPAQIERVAVAAVLYVSDPECAMALAELEDAVADLAAQPAETGSTLANALAIVRRLPASRLHLDASPAPGRGGADGGGA